MGKSRAKLTPNSSATTDLGPPRNTPPEVQKPEMKEKRSKHVRTKSPLAQTSRISIARPIKLVRASQRKMDRTIVDDGCSETLLGKMDESGGAEGCDEDTVRDLRARRPC